MKPKYIYLENIHSTNEFASEYISKNKPTNIICIYTYNQTCGKGQIGRTWHSKPDKNLTLTLIMPLSVSVEKQILINKQTSIYVRDFVESFCELSSPKIKWPNDIYIKDKKVGGILVQNILKGKEIKYCMVGIGLNVYQQRFPETIPNPTSFVNEGFKKQISLLDMIIRFCSGFPNLQFLKDEKELSEIYERQLYGKNTLKTFVCKDEKIKGTIIEVNKKGQLVLSIKGEIKAYNFGEISLVTKHNL